MADWGAGALSPEAERRFTEGVEYCGRFFMGEADAQRALYRITELLEADRLPYAWVRDKFLELWTAVAQGEANDPY